MAEYVESSLTRPDSRQMRPSRLQRIAASIRGWVRHGDATVAQRELEYADWRQMRRLAEACNDQDFAVGVIYEEAGVSNAQRFSLRGPR